MAAPVSAASGEEAVAKKRQRQPVAYSVTLFDGAELRLEFGAGATVRDAYDTAAATRGLPWYRIRLVAKGQQRPLVPSLERLEDATGGVRELLLVAVSGVTLAEGSNADWLEDCTLEHHPDSCFERCDGQGLAQFVGKRLTLRNHIGVSEFVVKFWCVPGEPTLEAAPLWGKAMIRAVVHQRSLWALGVGTRELNTNGDPGWRRSFYGLQFHMGAKMVHVSAAGARVFECSLQQVPERLAVLVDVEGCVMRCYCGLTPFGPPIRGLPSGPLWPVIVASALLGSASLSVQSTQLEA